jgi:threonine dehydratase
MEQNGITLAVSPLLKGRLLVADATANRTNAYKIRGALAALLAAQRQGAKSVWTASAGNHGAGVASSADRLGIPATVYVPDGAPAVKVEKIRGLGARVVHTGDSFDECLQSARAQERASLSGAHFIHPFDDFMVVAGQGTIGVELIEHAAVECARNNYSRVRFFLPIGGGGLAAGVASVIKTAWPKGLPTPEIIGVIDESSPAAMIGMSFGRQVAANPDTIADGTRVAVVGKTFLEVANLVDTVMLVPHDALVETMRRFHGKTGRMLEPAGALALTAERLSYQYSLFHDNDEALSIPLITGTNIDPTVFQDHISQPARLNQQSHARVGFDVSIPEMPGELLHFLKSVRPFNIASLTYKQASTQGRGTLRAEFEISRTEYLDLVAALHREFPGSAQLRDGQQMVFEVGAPIAADFRDELVTLKDRSGSFLRYVQTLSDQGELGTVGFLYYRKPSRPGADGQVVIGRH